jgi:hypothetical protein
MIRTSLRSGVFVGSGLLLASCYGAPSSDEAVAEVSQAVSVCDETVPANRIVDGIPAYAQCTASTNAAIYSNNGIDTATSANASDWKVTQRSGGYQCTELVHRYWLFRWNVTWIPNGNAGTWCDTTPPSTSGIVQTTTPVHGDAIVFAGGVCGASASTGHIALVDTVDTAGSKVTFVEQNSAGRRTGAFSCATCFLHVLANDGSAGGSIGIGGVAGATSSSGGVTAAGGTPATGGRSSSAGGTSAATGGRSAASGGATTTRGGSSSATGGSATTTGGASTPMGGRSTIGGASSPFTGGNYSPATGGALTSGVTTGGQNSSTGGVAPVGGMTNGIGGATALATGGANTTGTPATTTGGNAVGGNVTTASAGQSVAQVLGVPEPDSGCNCKLPSGNSPSSTGIGWFGMALVALIGLRKNRQGSIALRPRHGGQPCRNCLVTRSPW